ncbi:MAG: prepilin-type N-terminal cleavage/methylation domain-containing protein [Eubacterium sp.]|nr:prepilin-type N-terminal cleavage/methylation domain-containing protein [Eubacterium sp.]
MRRAYRNKEGFSLMELIITIAIMVVFVGMVSLSFALMRSADTKGLASGINDSLTDLKADTESHAGPYYLHIYKAEDSYYSTFTETEAFDPDTLEKPVGTKLGAPNLSVKYKDTTTGRMVCIGEDDVIATVQIRKKDGAYLKAPPYFDVYNGTTLEYRVVLAKDTGLHYVEKM